MMKNVRNESRLYIPLYLTPFIMLIIIVLIISIDYYWHVRKSLVDDVISLYKESMKTVSHGYDNLSKDMILSSEVLSHSVYFRKMLTEKGESVRSLIPSLTEDLEMIRKESDDRINSFRLYDSEKRLIFSFPPDKKNDLMMKEGLDEMLSSVVERRMPEVKFLEGSKSTGKTYANLIFAAPVFTGEDLVNGSLVFQVDLNSVNRDLLSGIKNVNRDLKLVDEPQIFLISTEGHIVYRAGSSLTELKEPIPPFLKTLLTGSHIGDDDLMSTEVRIAEKGDLYYLIAPVHLSVMYKKTVVPGPSFFLLFIISKSIFHRHLSVSILYIVIASVSLVALLMIPGVIIFRRLYALEIKRTQAFERELKMAYDIQLDFLPKETIEIPGYEVFCMSKPARQVGGDFYNVISLSTDTYGIVIGDASGKGVPGAFLMILGKTLIDFVAHQEHDPAQVLQRVNRFIEKTSGSDMFLTVLFASLDIERKTLTYAAAGHSPPLLLRDGTVVELEGGQGAVLGCFPEIHFEKKEILLEKDDLLILYTDGCTDVWNEKKEKIREEDIWKGITMLKDPSAKDVATEIIQTIESFQGSNEQYDDRTLIIIKVNE